MAERRTRTSRAEGAPELALRVLGELAVEKRGERLPLPPSKKTRALLGYLLLEPREHTREQLCALFWDGPDDPRGALRWSLSRLRPLLHGAAGAELRADRERVQLAPGAAFGDLRAARELAGRASDVTEAELREACALFRGELLEGLELADAYAFQAFCTGWREQARRLRLSLLEALASRLSARPDEALAVARQIVAVDPAAESAHRRVMQLLSALGRPREALRQYDECRAILRSTAGASPSQEMEAARRALAIGPAAPAPHAPAEPAPAPRAEARGQAAPLVGRAAETAALEAALREGRGLTLLLGEPGIGKTRLLEELGRRAREAGTAVIAGRSYEAERVRPYGAFIDALRGAPVLQLADARLRQELSALLPELSAEAAPAGDRTRLYDAVTDLLRAAAQRGRVLLLLDDAHWIDEGSAALAHYLARTLAQERVALVAAAREGELPDNPAALRLQRTLRRDGLISELRVGPLDAAAVAQLLDVRGLRADARRVHAESNGNPLFALEMARALAEGRPLASGTLAGILDQRLSAVDAAAQALLPWAAALGRTWTLPLLAAATSRPLGELLEALAVLERHGLVRAHQDGASWDFAHDLLREAAWRRVPAARRRTLHGVLARTLWEQPGGQGPLAAAVAHHALLAGEDALAVRASAAAAQHSLRVFAFEDVRRLVDRALPLLPALPRDQRHLVELSLLEAAVFASGPAADDASILRRLTELVLEAEAAGKSDVVAHALLVLSWGHYLREDEPGARGASIRAAEAGRRSADPLVRARSLAQAGRCLAQLERDVDKAEQMLTEAEALAGGAPLLDLPYGLGLLHAYRGRPGPAKAAFERAASLAHGAADHWRECETLFALTRIAVEERDAAAALRWAERALPVAQRLPGGFEPVQARAMLALARVCAARAEGRDDPDAERTFDAACDELHAREGFQRLSLIWAERAELEAKSGRLDEAERFAQRAAGLERGDAIQLRRSRCKLVLAEVALGRGQRAAAREHLAAALAVPGALPDALRGRVAQALSRAAPESTLPHTASPTQRA